MCILVEVYNGINNIVRCQERRKIEGGMERGSGDKKKVEVDLIKILDLNISFMKRGQRNELVMGI